MTISKIVCTLAALCVAATAVAVDTDGLDTYVFGLSWHSQRHAGFNEVNPGFALGYRLKFSETLDMGPMVGGYEDSYRKQANLLLWNVRETYGPRERLHVSGAVAAGVIQGSGMNGPAVLPIIGFGYNVFNVEGTVVHTGNTWVAAGWVRLSWVIAPF